MTVEVQTIAPCRQKLIITASADEARKPYDELIAEFTKQCNPPGFRAGKAPRAVIERVYRADIDKEAKRVMVGKFYRKALEQEKISAVDIVDIGSVLFSPATGASFTITIDVAPEFKLPQYKGVPVRVEQIAVTESQIDEQVDRMRLMFANLAPSEGPSQKDDVATVDYEATVDGKPLAELAPNLPYLTGAKDQTIRVGNPMGMPKEFDDAMLGAKPGETVVFDVPFASDFYVQALQGVTAKYSATVKALKRPELLDDAALLEKVQFTKGMEALRADIRQDLERQAAQRMNQQKFQIIAQHLDSRCKFDLPKAETARAVNRAAQQIISNISQGGATREQIEEHRDALLQNATDSAERQLRMKYILARIADEEKITATDAEVNQRIREIAYEHRQPFEKAKAELEKNYGLETIRDEVRRQKAASLLVAESTAQ